MLFPFTKALSKFKLNFHRLQTNLKEETNQFVSCLTDSCSSRPFENHSTHWTFIVQHFKGLEGYTTLLNKSIQRLEDPVALKEIEHQIKDIILILFEETSALSKRLWEIDHHQSEFQFLPFIEYEAWRIYHHLEHQLTESVTLIRGLQLTESHVTKECI